jgi:plastocyanin
VNGSSRMTTWGRTAIVGVALVGALALFPGAHSAPAASCGRAGPGVVRVNPDALLPATIRIAPGASVTWIACGAGPRRVASVTAAWPPFVLRSNQERRVVFRRAGRYRYRVDGKLEGTVVVGAVGTAQPGASGAAERTVRYDIRVSAGYRYRERLDGALVETSIAYVGVWSGVVIRIYDAFGTFTAVGRGERGTIDAKLTFSDARGDTVCDGVVDYPRYPAVAAITAGRVRASPPYVNFASNLADDGPFGALTDARTAACDDLPASDGRTVWLGSSFTGTQGVRIDPPGAGIAETDARFSRNGGAALPFPLDRLRAGQAFTVTGRRTVGPQSCGAGCTETSTGSVEFRFTPRR